MVWKWFERYERARCEVHMLEDDFIDESTKGGICEVLEMMDSSGERRVTFDNYPLD